MVESFLVKNKEEGKKKNEKRKTRVHECKTKNANQLGRLQEVHTETSESFKYLTEGMTTLVRK